MSFFFCHILSKFFCKWNYIFIMFSIHLQSLRHGNAVPPPLCKGRLLNLLPSRQCHATSLYTREALNTFLNIFSFRLFQSLLLSLHNFLIFHMQVDLLFPLDMFRLLFSFLLLHQLRFQFLHL